MCQLCKLCKLCKIIIKLNFYVFNKCVNQPLQNGYSSRESTISPYVLGRPFLTVSKTDPVSINFLCHR